MFVDYRESGILVLEDDVFTLKVLAETLRNLGFSTIFTSSSVTSAVNTLTQSVADIVFVLSDLNLPGEDALDLFQFLEEIEFRGGIILCSGMGPQAMAVAEVIAKSRHLNVIGTLQKPVQPKQLVALVNDFCETGAPGRGPTEIKGRVSPDDLALAIEEDLISAWFQPKMDDRTLKLAGFEALSRWKHGVHGYIPPEVFIPLAEEFGFINQLTLSIAHQCSQTITDWRQLLNFVKVNSTILWK